MIWHRQLARTTKHQRLVLLPPKTKKGDVICILYGCSVPVVLTKTEMTTRGISRGLIQETGGQPIWNLVGECYMDGMMSGDALVFRRQRFEQEDAKCTLLREKIEARTNANRKTARLERKLKEHKAELDFYRDRRVFKIR